jgi:hypothetical protein
MGGRSRLWSSWPSTIGDDADRLEDVDGVTVLHGVRNVIVAEADARLASAFA